LKGYSIYVYYVNIIYIYTIYYIIYIYLFIYVCIYIILNRIYIYYVRSNAAHTQKLYLCFTTSGKRLFCLSFASPWFWEYVCPRFVFRFGSFLFLFGVDRAWPTFFWKGLQCIGTFGLGWKGVIVPIKSRTHQKMNFWAASTPEKKHTKLFPSKVPGT
jgi:hypothetical protein